MYHAPGGQPSGVPGGVSPYGGDASLTTTPPPGTVPTSQAGPSTLTMPPNASDTNLSSHARPPPTTVAPMNPGAPPSVGGSHFLSSVGSFAPNFLGTPTMPSSAQDTNKTTVKKPKGPSRPVGRPPLAGRATGARRGRPPRNPRPLMEETAPMPASSTASRPPGVSMMRPGWTPVLTMPQQQAMLSRAVQVSKAQNRASFTPFHALLQMGCVFVRNTQCPYPPTVHVGEGAVLRLDEAASLGLLPPHMAQLARSLAGGNGNGNGAASPGMPMPLPASSPRPPDMMDSPGPTATASMAVRPPPAPAAAVTPSTAAAAITPTPAPTENVRYWPELPTPQRDRPLVDGGVPSLTNVAGIPITTHNTQLTKLPIPLPEAADDVYKPLTEKDTEELRTILENDASFRARMMQQQKAMDTELYVRVARLMQPTRPLPWWETSALPDAPKPPSESLHLIYPAQRQRALEQGVRGVRPAVPLDVDEVAHAHALYVPIRLELEHEPYKLRDTFVWNAAEPDSAMDIFAVGLCEDVGVPTSVFVELIKSSIQWQVQEYTTAMALRAVEVAPEANVEGRGQCTETQRMAWDALRTYVWAAGTKPAPPIDEETPPMIDEQDELRIVIKLDILVGATHLVDQFEWDLRANDTVAAERFAQAYTADLGLGGEFTTAVAHSIREQVGTHIRWLTLLGYPFHKLTQMDEEVRTSFLPPLAPEHSARPHEAVDQFTPKLVQLHPNDVAMMEREYDRDVRRKRRQTKGRRGATTIDHEPQRTIRSLPLWGLQGATPDLEKPPVLHARRAAAAAAANMLMHESSAHDDHASPAPSTAKRVKQEYQDMLFRYPGGLGPFMLRRTASAPRYGGAWAAQTATATTAAAAATNTTSTTPMTSGAEPKNAFHVPPRHVRPEDLERQHPTMIHGQWHCANCGMPGDMDAARRKGPAGEKTLCGPCGKYYHRHRRVPNVKYTLDADYHRQQLGIARALPPPTATTTATAATTDDPSATFLDSGSDEEAAPSAPPSWLTQAVEHCRTKYPTDRFHVQPRIRPADIPPDGDDWRIKCVDCPGKVYKPGPGESLANFEIHLKNRSHRTAVAKRLEKALLA